MEQNILQRAPTASARPDSNLSGVRADGSSREESWRVEEPAAADDDVKFDCWLDEEET